MIKSFFCKSCNKSKTQVSSSSPYLTLYSVFTGSLCVLSIPMTVPVYHWTCLVLASKHFRSMVWQLAILVRSWVMEDVVLNVPEHVFFIPFSSFGPVQWQSQHPYYFYKICSTLSRLIKTFLSLPLSFEVPPTLGTFFGSVDSRLNTLIEKTFSWMKPAWPFIIFHLPTCTILLFT